MSQESGTVASFNNTFTHGRLSHDQNAGASIDFASDQVAQLASLSVGERVTFEIVQDVTHEDQQGQVVNVQRIGGDLEAYQDQGGLYS